MSSNGFRVELESAVNEIAIVDTHEHIPPEGPRRTGLGLFGFLEHYVSSDLVSAGMSREALEAVRCPENGMSFEERWRCVSSYWPYVMTTGYGRALQGYMAELFGVVPVDEGTCVVLCRRIEEAHGTSDWYRTVLKEKANIAVALVTRWSGQSVEVDRGMFRAIPVLDHFAMVSTRAELEVLEGEAGSSIQTLHQLMAAQEMVLDRFVGQGIAGVKVFLAYRRPLCFERVEESVAARVFDRIWLSQVQDLCFADLKPLQDFMTRRLIGLAAERGLPVQIHTGMQEGNGNYLEYSNPLHLTNLFMEFQDTRFDVFHAGFPYSGEVAVLAKYFPNVYADLCWIPAVSPCAAGRILSEWIEVIPSNKILAVGGDSNYVEGAYQHTRVARRVVCEALVRKVESGYLTEGEAVWMAGRMVRENARDLFELDL